MSTILDEIVAYKREFVEEARKHIPMEELLEVDELGPPPTSLFDALAEGKGAGNGDDEGENGSGIAVIAEIKKASPSKGVIREDFDPLVIAKIYKDNGAAAISVLTDEKYFQGSIDVLTQVGNVVDIPILRKDFVSDPYQIYEARAIGASAILLLVAILTPEELESYMELAEEIHLDALVEVHTESELQVALETGAEIIGINNRNLKTFTTDLETTETLIEKVPEDIVVVSESGIHTRADVERVLEAGADAVLVGESLMAEDDIASKLHHLLGSAG